MKIAKRDIKLLLILVGLLIFLALYLAVFNPFQDRTEKVQLRIDELKPQVEELEGHYLHLSEYEDEIKKNRTKVQQLLENFPADVKEEDTLSYLLGLESREEIRMETVTFNGSQLLREFDAVIPRGGEDQKVAANMYSTSTLMTGRLTYPQAKNVIRYLYNTAKQTTLESVALAYDPATAQLEGNFMLDKYYLQWPDAEYTPERVPVTTMGVKDLFATT